MPAQTVSQTLVCFGLELEARPFRRLVRGRPEIEVFVTGMGQANAGLRLLRQLERPWPAQLLTCGLAGGLDPRLTTGTVGFEADEGFALSGALADAGAQPMRFCCVDRIVATASGKQSLFKETGAEAVEMESKIIRAACRERGIPSATVRVISDSASEDLPLDFNRYLTRQQRLNYAKLGLGLLQAPFRIGELLRFNRQTASAAAALARVLAQVLK